MPVNLNVSSTEPSIHTARDCVGNREKRARLVAFLDGADPRRGAGARRGRGSSVDTRSGRYRPAGQGAGRGRLFRGAREAPRGPRRPAAALEVLVWLCFCTRFSPRLDVWPPRDRVSHGTSSVIAPRGIRFRYGSSNSQYVRYGSSNSQYVRYGQYHRESVLVRFRRSGYRVMLNPPRQVPSD